MDEGGKDYKLGLWSYTWAVGIFDLFRLVGTLRGGDQLCMDKSLAGEICYYIHHFLTALFSVGSFHGFRFGGYAPNTTG